MICKKEFSPLQYRSGYMQTDAIMFYDFNCNKKLLTFKKDKKRGGGRTFQLSVFLDVPA